MSRNICVTTAEGNTGFLIIKLLLTDPKFRKNVDRVTALAINTQSSYVQELEKLGAVIAQHRPGRVHDTAQVLRYTEADTLMLIPPAHVNKIDITLEILEAAKRVNIGNVCLLSAAGCDMADRDAQPRLGEFIELEVALMKMKGDPSTRTGYSNCIIRFVIAFQCIFYIKDLEYCMFTRIGLVSMRRIFCCIHRRPKRKGYFQYPLGRTINSLLSL
jgi:hypothetical protein